LLAEVDRDKSLASRSHLTTTFPWTWAFGPSPIVCRSPGRRGERASGMSPHERRSAVRLPPQVSGVVRRTMDRPAYGDAYRGIRTSATSQSITCQSNEVLCSCTGNKYACCSSNLCHV